MHSTRCRRAWTRGSVHEAWELHSGTWKVGDDCRVRPPNYDLLRQFSCRLTGDRESEVTVDSCIAADSSYKWTSVCMYVLPNSVWWTKPLQQSTNGSDNRSGGAFLPLHNKPLSPTVPCLRHNRGASCKWRLARYSRGPCTPPPTRHHLQAKLGAAAAEGDVRQGHGARNSREITGTDVVGVICLRAIHVLCSSELRPYRVCRSNEETSFSLKS